MYLCYAWCISANQKEYVHYRDIRPLNSLSKTSHDFQDKDHSLVHTGLVTETLIRPWFDGQVCLFRVGQLNSDGQCASRSRIKDLGFIWGIHFYILKSMNMLSVGSLKCTWDIWQECIITVDLSTTRENKCFAANEKEIHHKLRLFLSPKNYKNMFSSNPG